MYNPDKQERLDSYERAVKASAPLTLMLPAMIVVFFVTNIVTQGYPHLTSIAPALILVGLIGGVAVWVDGIRRKQDPSARQIKLMSAPMWVALGLLLVIDIALSMIRILPK